MGHAAVDAVEEALDETKELLLPFDWRLWAKIAIIALFAGSIGGNIPTPGGSGGMDTGVPETGGQYDMPQTFGELPLGMHIGGAAGPSSTAIMAAAGLLLVLIFVFGLLSSIFDFVLFRSLQTKDVHIRPYVKDHFRQGARLFGFRIGFLLLLLIGGAAVFGGAMVAPASVLVLGPVALVALIAWLVASVFVGWFLPLIMLNEEVGAVEGMKQLYTTLRPQWKDTLIYVFAQFVLGIAVSVVSILAGVVMLLPLALFALPLVMFGGVAGTAAALLLVLLGGGVAYLYLVNGPTTVFTGYYHVLVYDELVAEQL